MAGEGEGKERQQEEFEALPSLSAAAETGKGTSAKTASPSWLHKTSPRRHTMQTSYTYIPRITPLTGGIHTPPAEDTMNSYHPPSSREHSNDAQRNMDQQVPLIPKSKPSKALGLGKFFSKSFGRSKHSDLPTPEDYDDDEDYDANCVPENPNVRPGGRKLYARDESSIHKTSEPEEDVSSRPAYQDCMNYSGEYENSPSQGRDPHKVFSTQDNRPDFHNQQVPQQRRAPQVQRPQNVFSTRENRLEIHKHQLQQQHRPPPLPLFRQQRLQQLTNDALNQALIALQGSENFGDHSENQAINVDPRNRYIYTRENQIPRLAEQLSFSSAGDDKGVAMLQLFLRAVAKGNMDTMSLPQTPPVLISGNNKYGYGHYLSAPYPEHEDAIVEQFQRVETLWSQWSDESEQVVKDVVLSMMSRFETEGGAFSLFNTHQEILKFQRGYGVNQLPRDLSLAAHALYSQRCVFNLDMREAFQFLAHPLVVGFPKIRFFAAVPLLTQNGVPYGTIAMWSQKKRAAFSIEDIFQLDAVAQQITAEIEKQLTLITPASGRSTPLLQRDSLTDGDCDPSTMSSRHPTSPKRYDTIPPVAPLRYFNEKAPFIGPSDSISEFPSVNGHFVPRPHSEQTPPSSAEDSQGPSFGNLSRGFNNINQLPRQADSDPIWPTISNQSQDSVRRPYSIMSELSAIQAHDGLQSRTHTPSRSGTPHNDIAGFMALRDEDVTENPEDGDSLRLLLNYTNTNSALHQSIPEIEASIMYQHDNGDRDVQTNVRSLGKCAPQPPVYGVSTFGQINEQHATHEPLSKHLYKAGSIRVQTLIPITHIVSRIDTSGQAYVSPGGQLKSSFSSTSKEQWKRELAEHEKRSIADKKAKEEAFEVQKEKEKQKAIQNEPQAMKIALDCVGQWATKHGYNQLYAVELIPCTSELIVEGSPDGSNFAPDTRSYTARFLISFGCDSIKENEMKTHVKSYTCNKPLIIDEQEQSLYGIVFPYVPRKPEKLGDRKVVIGALSQMARLVKDEVAERNKIRDVMDVAIESVIRFCPNPAEAVPGGGRRNHMYYEQRRAAPTNAAGYGGPFGPVNNLNFDPLVRK
ncbi:hypothetical protein BJ878DRAFT_549764 [Calycina marina]|uniref:GAF domain-containing protein n=1 Tax=Calycina marina TaxID=1763456 RepID=A0A9P7Z3I5_9HELO|nr:hypothetical protein BJ878DRAFT_549764 [Calycina marina]